MIFRYKFYLGSDLDRSIVQTMLNDAAANRVLIERIQPLYILNERQRVILTTYAAEGSDEFEILARLDIQIDSDLEQLYLDSITP